MYTNTGNQAPDQFDIFSLDAMDLPDFVSESFFLPELVDLDQDGDLDLMNSGFDPPFAVEDGPNLARINYARNIGTKSVPNFQGWYDAPYNLVPDTIGELLTSGDIDNDGDIDFIGSMLGIPADSISYLLVHLNNPGADQKPAFTTPLKSPFGLPSLFGAVQYVFPKLADIDGDGDLDLFVFKGDDSSTVLEYYENSLCTITTEEVSFTICEGDILDFEGEQFTQAGTYEIHTVSEEGCPHIITLFLIVEVAPIVELEETICAGESVQVGEQIFTESGDYNVTLLTTNGCDSIVLLHLEVIDVDNTVTLQDETLTASLSGATYQWIDCDTGLDIPGATGQSYEVLETGNYAVHVTDGSDCSETSECVFVMITGLSDQLYVNEITLYPNPADKMISIRNESSLVISSMTLISITGQRVGEYEVLGATPIDISTLESGVYFAKIRSNDMEIVKKIVVI
jgi:hypothetical protein